MLISGSESRFLTEKSVAEPELNLDSAARAAMPDAISTMTQTRFVTLLSRVILSPVLGLVLIAPGAMATDWPQFRGPNRDGNWNETGILESFPRKGLRICWRHS